jgi:hypothetical protein
MKRISPFQMSGGFYLIAGPGAKWGMMPFLSPIEVG